MVLPGHSRVMCTAMPMPEIPAPTMIMSRHSSAGAGMVVAMFMVLFSHSIDICVSSSRLN